MARALYITHKEIYPVAGGDQVRFSQQLGLLADRFETDVLSLTHCRGARAPEEYESRISSSHTLYVPRLVRYRRAASTVLNRLPEVANHYADPRITRLVHDNAGAYDIIYCGSAAMARHVFGLDHPGLYLDMTDSLTMNYRNAASVTRNPVRKLILREQAVRMAGYERRCRDIFRRVAYISDIDREYIGYKPEKTAIVGNFVDIPPRAECSSPASDNHDVTFIGRMDYGPNIAAVRHFADIWKNCRRHGGIFNIVGGYAPPEIEALASESVRVTGFVPSLTPYFMDSALIVAPMLSGSGIQNKILQALAHGCCVLTTPVGAEGLDRDSGAFVVASPGGDFAKATENLLADPHLRAQIGATAREYVGSRFSRRSIADQFSAFIAI